MKRIYIILFVFLPMLTQAGVIMKRSGERLEDVIIKSVTDTEIIYEFNGIETTLPKSEVSAILYDDGRYEEIKSHKVESVESGASFIYDEQEAKRVAQEQRKLEAEEKRQQHEAAKAAALEKARIEEEQARIAKEQAQIEKERKLQDGQIHRISSNSWYYIDKYYTKKEINSIILSCPDAKAKYDDGHKWMVAGWSSAAGSVALLIIGSSMMAADTQVWYENGHQYRYSGEVWAAGLPLMLLGVCGIPTGITIAGIGHHRMNNSYKVFNNSCVAQQEPAISLNFGPTRNGLGLTLYF